MSNKSDQTVASLQGSSDVQSPFKRHLWQYIFAWSLILVWAAFFCVYLEGKSSYDLAFTLWDDNFARVFMEPMGRFILPEMIFYSFFFVGMAVLVAIFVNSPHFKQFTIVLLVAAGAFLIFFTFAFGITQLTFVGGRQGPTGWVILEWPWVSLILFCLVVALGLVGVWLLMAQEIPRITTISKGSAIIKQWLLTIMTWALRILSIIGIIIGSVALNAGLILAFNHINAALVVAACGCAAAMVMVFFKKDVLKADFKQKSHGTASPVERIQAGARNLRFFTADRITDQDGTEFARTVDFLVNPRNIAWRPLRNFMNGVLTSVCIFLVTAMCFMTVPDEWGFQRMFDLLPWITIGILAGTFILFLVPEPAIFYPFILVHVAQTYARFLSDFGLPFEAGFIEPNGMILGFTIAMVVVYQFFVIRAKSKAKNFSMTIFLTLAFMLAWWIVAFVPRFQHDGQMVQRPITDVMNVIMPLFTSISQVFLILSIAFWIVDFVYRILRGRTRIAPIRQPAVASLASTSTRPRKNIHLLETLARLPERKKKMIALVVLGIFIGSFSLVQGTIVYANQVPPMLIRNEDFGIWTVSGTTKVEKSFPVQMPSGGPAENEINVSAARGEWEGFHVLISPQRGKSATLEHVNWTNFVHESNVTSLNASIMEVFLVAYLVDEEPDQLLELPVNVTRQGGEHIDLFYRLKVPRNATAGSYSCTIELGINTASYPVNLSLEVFNFTIPKDNHLRTAFGGGWETEAWFDELDYLRISQYDMGIPFRNGYEYTWNSGSKYFDFNWTEYDTQFQDRLDHGMTGIRQGYWPPRPSEVTNDTEWAQIEADFLSDVSAHLENMTWLDEIGTNRSWVEIPYLYWIDEPPTSDYPYIRSVNNRYHAGTSHLRTLLTEEYHAPTCNWCMHILDECVDIWCPVIGNFDPAAVVNRHAVNQEYWFYVCVGPVAPYPNFQLWEPGHNPRLNPYICAGFNADGFLYWSMTASNDTYHAGFDGNGDGQICFVDPNTGRPLPSLRLLSFSAGVEDYEYIWLMRKTVEKQGEIGPIPSDLLARASSMETRLSQIVGAKPQFVNHDVNVLMNFRQDLADLLEDLWPYTEKLY
nr:DUF4091 domain-containing protein [Candidatus Sigynarchaeota archaeon]